MLVVAALLLAVAALVAFGSEPAQAHPSTFPDVSETDPSHDAIEALAQAGIISGNIDGEFMPESPLTRGQATKILVGWRGESSASASTSTTSPGLDTVLEPTFPDVDQTFISYVEVAADNGWVAGYPDGTFRPARSLTREQMAIVVIRALGLEDEALGLAPYRIDSTLNRFLDDVAISPNARPYMALAVIGGLFSGDGGRLYPLDPMSRAQFSLVVHRADGLPTDPDTGEVLSPVESETAANGSGFAPHQLALAEFMDTYLFGPHNSPVTGMMVLQNAEWYGIPPLSQLVIMAAETSLGDPKLGGTLARRNNFGCMRYHGANTPWGLLSDGRVWVAGKDWYSFPTPEIGMAAWGRYLKSAMDGFYVPILNADRPDWYRFAAVYYGKSVSGFSSYVSRLKRIESSFRSTAAAHGVSF